MKKYTSMVLAVIMLLLCIFTQGPQVDAAGKPEKNRTIAIVFDNSGSMSEKGNKAWCRATYAMEVFASMLNTGDTLMIYPMHPITVNGKEYSKEKEPFVITDASQASLIREIVTPRPIGTPIQTVDYAADGLRAANSNTDKYLIILTDGVFDDGNLLISQSALDKRVTDNAGPDMKVMYLAIGESVSLPSVEESEYFVSVQADESEAVLSSLTMLCNKIFGRDTLPKERISGSSMEFDISMKKLIVFVQGENIANLNVTDSSGKAVGQVVRTQDTKYSTVGVAGATPDPTLQGMMVTYTDCAAGTYTINHSGTASSIEVYYEPDADLEFVFTDRAGNVVDLNALYEDTYIVSYGMKDAKTGKLIESDLLGNPQYQGNYYINEEAESIERTGFKGEEKIPLMMGDTFRAELTVTYLGGYTITKSFGGDGGVKVAPRPAGDMRLEVSVGESEYSLQDLEDGKPCTVKVFYQDNQLTGAELEKVALTWDAAASNATLTKEFAEDHFKLYLNYKDPNDPQSTVCGECSVPLTATYAAQGSDEATANGVLTYSIKDDFSPLQMQLDAPEDYIVIGDLDKSKEILVTLTLNGAPLVAEDFKNARLEVDTGGIKYTATPNQADSTYVIKLHATDGIEEGDYTLKVTAFYTDHIGRETQVSKSADITLSTMPLWLKWLIISLLILLLLIVIWLILHIKVLPKHLHTTKKLSNMVYDGEDVTNSTSFESKLSQKSVTVSARFGGRPFAVSMDVTPGADSYLYKSQKRRSALVKVASVHKLGPSKIQEVTIGSVKYVLDEDTNKLTPAIPGTKPFTLINGVTVRYSGTIQDAGIDKDFEVTSKLDFKKK